MAQELPLPAQTVDRNGPTLAPQQPLTERVHADPRLRSRRGCVVQQDLIRLGQATQLTRDHTVAADQERLGLLSAREAAKAETRHTLSRSLGNDLFVNVEVSERQVFAEDVLLLCSDGLYGAVSATDMAATVTHNASLEVAARKLVALANRRDGGDNISVQLIRIRGVERVGMYRGRPYRLH